MEPSGRRARLTPTRWAPPAPGTSSTRPRARPEAATPVRVLPEQEEALVEEPDLFPRGPARDQTRAGDPVDLERRGVLDGQRRDLARAHWVFREQPAQGGG